MSLTKLIKGNKEFRDHFINTFPKANDMKKLFKTVNSNFDPFDKKNPIKASPIEGTKATNVGTSYDYWFRIQLQKIKGEYLEKDFKQKTAYNAIIWLKEDGCITQEQHDKYMKIIMDIQKKRKDYVNGINIRTEELVRDCCQLTLFNNYFRYRDPEYALKDYEFINEKEVEDVLNIANKTLNSELFANVEELHCNPTFEHNSGRVGGADADFILNKTLYDIKTVKEIKYDGNDVYQIIGYYILAHYGFMGKKYFDVDRIGFYFPRFDHAIVLDIETLEKTVDMEAFVDGFFDRADKIVGYFDI